MTERTLVWDVFGCIFEAERRRIKPVWTFRNPIFLAQELAEAMKRGQFRTQSEFARTIGVSRARINQILRLLKLPPKIQESAIRTGDPLPSRKITERRLRTLLSSTQVE